MERVPILDVRGLSITFSQYTGVLTKKNLEVISDLSVKLFQGEIVAVVGASGSGKSLLAHSILGILPCNASMGGQINYCGQPLTRRSTEKLRGTEIVLVPQSVSYLDPLMRVGAQIRRGRRGKDIEDKTLVALERFGLERNVQNLYPFELSGGMARRVLISTAVLEKPKLVIADEPTPGLHVEAAKSVLAHFREIADEGAAVLLITHDLEFALEVADRVVVFYSGMTLEEAKASDFLEVSKLRHPYTKALYHAMPKNGFLAIAGKQPYAGDRTSGCPFFKSCDFAGRECQGEIPYIEIDGGFVRCVKGGSYEARG